jgi:AcrR family transcriptional regulator
MATPLRERNKRGEGERLREALLDAAGELLDDSPDLEQLSVRAVTARAGVSPTALYLHFADKDDLARAVKKRCFAALSAVLREAEALHEGDPGAQAHAMGLAYLRYAREHPGHYAMLFHSGKTGRQRPRPAPADVRAAGMETFQLLVDAVARWRPDDPDVYESACMLWLALHGRAAIQQTMPWFPLPDEERYVTRLGDQLAARS